MDEVTPFYRRAKKDGNHLALVKAMRQVPGLCVIESHAMGSGFPDLIVCHKGVVVLMEVKDPKSAMGKAALADKDRSGQTSNSSVTLTKQAEFRVKWRAAGGLVVTVYDLHSALAALGISQT